ncbi:MAG: PAS domain-containing protein [Deltaproteobacteria bacterium]|nr:PAS domain-containing protein [Deltaproteobacteria bacterium]
MAKDLNSDNSSHVNSNSKQNFKQEESVLQSEKALLFIINNIPGNIAYVGIDDLRYKFVNKLFEKNFKRSYDEIVGKHIREIIGESNYQYALKYIDEVRAGRSASYENEFTIKDGKRWISVNYVPGFNSQGKVEGIMVLSYDITERKQMEKELIASTKRLELATESGRLGIWDWDLVNDSMVWNDRMFELYGISRNTFSNNIDAWVTGLHQDDKQRAIDECDIAIEGKQDFNTTFRVMHPDGTIVHIKADGMVIRDNNGKAIRMTGINRDISEQKRMEEMLFNSQKLESLGLLAGGIAHDFNNLLGGIFGYIDLANARSQDENVSRYLSKATGAIDRARGLTQQLLTFAKGGTPIKKVQTLFPFLMETAQFALSGSSVSCQYDIQDELLKCSFDKNQLGQVFDNIIINAQQAMPYGRVINITARNITLNKNEHPALESGNYVKISIQDSGIGIPLNYLSRIFDPFFTTKPKGHGLGLATCYSIVTRHDGCIVAESEPGKGSTFHIYLPSFSESPIAES